MPGCFMATPSLGVFITPTNISSKATLSHVILFTVAEFAAIRAVILNVKTESPQFFLATFVDSKAGLQTLLAMKTCIAYLHTAHKTFKAARRATCQGHNIILQLLPAHSGIAGNISADRAARNARESALTGLIFIFEV